MERNESIKTILRDLRAMGIGPGDSLLVHSSYKSLGFVEGGVKSVIEALKEAVCDGTLMLPALSYNSVGPKNPVFDVRKTPCCVGIIPELFRASQGVWRSYCPTHSVAVWGNAAQQIARAHTIDHTPCGEHSPFAELARRGGKILMLGCGLHPNTSMHGVEELVRPDYLFNGSVDYTVTTDDGTSFVHPLMCHGFHKTNQRYDRVQTVLQGDELTCGQVLAAQCFLIDAAALWEKAAAALRKDPHHFVDIRA